MISNPTSTVELEGFFYQKAFMPCLLADDIPMNCFQGYCVPDPREVFSFEMFYEIKEFAISILYIVFLY